MEKEHLNQTEERKNDTEEHGGEGSTNVVAKVGLKRQVNLFNGIALLIGTIIGSGIFASPKAIANYVGSTGAILITWSGCGIISMLAALTWCELGTMFPNSSGGEYTYIMAAFGPLASFMYSFTTVLIVKPSSLVLIAITCGDNIMTAVGVGNQQAYSKIIAAVLLGLLIFVCLL